MNWRGWESDDIHYLSRNRFGTNPDNDVEYSGFDLVITLRLLKLTPRRYNSKCAITPFYPDLNQPVICENLSVSFPASWNNKSYVLYKYGGGGMRWRVWLRHWTTSRKVAGSISDELIWIFYWHNPSGRTMPPGWTQSLTEMNTRVKVAGAYNWQPCHLRVPIV